MRNADGRASSHAVLAAYVAMASGLVSLAGFELILVPLQTDLTFSVDSANALIFMPAAASLLVVFLAGSLADRWGPRRPLMLAAVFFTAGATVVCLAPSLPWVVLGRILDGVGGVAMAIIGLSVLSASATDPAKRARLFGVYAAIAPAMFMISPSLSAFLVQQTNWRVGVVPWVLMGALSFLASWRYIPSRRRDGRSEWLTPLLAGLVLAGVALGVLNASTNPMLSRTALAVGAVAFIGLIPAMRKVAKPSLNIRWCRGRGMTVLILALAVAAMPNLFFYTKLLLQYRYTVPLLTIAMLMAIPQACGLVGGLLSGPVSARIGPVRAAIGALVLSAITCLGAFFVTADAPILVPVLALSVSAFPVTFLVGPMTNVLMSRAPQDVAGAASSIRKATWTLGGVLGGAVIGYVSFEVFQTRLTSLLVDRGHSLSQAAGLARAIRDGAVVDELEALTTDPIARDALFAKGPALLQAQSATFITMCVLSASMYVLAAILMLIYLRRSEGPWSRGATRST